jgi:Domain of unknown function (DUF397)
VTAKPTVSELGIDLAAQVWHRSGQGDGVIEIAFARSGPTAHTAGDTAAHAAGNTNAHAAGDTTPDSAEPPADRAEWVLMRVTGDPDERVLVFDRHEWECFLDGARDGEFDDAAASP